MKAPPLALCALLAVACAATEPTGDLDGAASGTGTGGVGPVAGSPPPPPVPDPPPPITACFARGTPIATPHGEVPIEQIRVGDAVLAYSFAEQRVVSRMVTDTMDHGVREVMRLAPAEGPSVRVTANHPIYAVDRDRFEPAGELGDGARVLSLTALDAVAAVSMEMGAEVELAEVYDLTVDDLHNYFAGGVLVHNKARCWTNAEGCMVCADSPTATCMQTNMWMTTPQVATPDAGAAAGAAGAAGSTGTAGSTPGAGLCAATACVAGDLLSSDYCQALPCPSLESLSRGCIGSHREQACTACGQSFVRANVSDETNLFFDASGTLQAVQRLDQPSLGCASAWYGLDLSDCVPTEAERWVPCDPQGS